ncbi:phosphatase PAP2 family protein [Kitasatospora sp. NPDC127111]|uniref:phosphatase PAP2 family protein n=1 Tax=Kitasatospora sp. NPDC127111 TaxID=3345363 RepID=UPI003636724B
MPETEPVRPIPLLRDLDTIDQVVYAAVAKAETPALDVGLRRLSRAADHSKISLTLAALLALRPGRTRRAALGGVAALGLASATANLLGKRIVRRPRPNRAAAEVVVGRHVPMPASTSFPSGHTASAVAFAVAVGAGLPEAALPLGLLAGAVGYSRVHTGVHYPGDVVAGSVLGATCAAAVTWAGTRSCRSLTRTAARG